MRAARSLDLFAVFPDLPFAAHPAVSLARDMPRALVIRELVIERVRVDIRGRRGVPPRLAREQRHYIDQRMRTRRVDHN